MTSIDEQFVEYIIKSLVGKPDAVQIERTIDEKGVLLELTVDPEDLGRVIGKRGATAQSVRTLLRALGTKNEARYNLKIVDNGVPKPERERRSRDEDVAKPVKAEEEKPKDETVEDEAPVDVPEVPEVPVEAPVEEVEAPEEEESLADKTRRELGELDDLDLD